MVVIWDSHYASPKPLSFDAAMEPSLMETESMPPQPQPPMRGPASCYPPRWPSQTQPTTTVNAKHVAGLRHVCQHHRRPCVVWRLSLPREGGLESGLPKKSPGCCGGGLSTLGSRHRCPKGLVAWAPLLAHLLQGPTPTAESSAVRFAARASELRGARPSILRRHPRRQ